MVILALSILGVAALGGVVVAAYHLDGREPPRLLVVGHGAVGVTGLACLAADFLGREPHLWNVVALVLFTATAISGTLLLGVHLRRGRLAAPLLGVHFLLALTGFVALLVDVTLM